jgi:tripartite-type tricarboxylate transporter receptor subunit TctC
MSEVSITQDEQWRKLERVAYVDRVSLDEFVAFAKARPGQLNYSMFEKGALVQMWLDWFLKRLGLQLQHIPYKSGPELVTAAATGVAAITISSVTSSQSFIDSGKLIPIVVTSPSLKSQFPSLPLVSDILPDSIDPNSSMILFGPPGLPANILNVLSRELLKAQSSPDVRNALTKVGLMPPEEETRRMERKLKEYTILIDGNQ